MVTNCQKDLEIISSLHRPPGSNAHKWLNFDDRGVTEAKWTTMKASYVLISCMESWVKLPIPRLTRVPGWIKTLLLKDLEVAPDAVDSLLEPATTRDL